jgi:DNA polymerase-1
LEECFIRQIRVDNNEADDLIAYYCLIGTDEQKVILSADQDLIQLVSPTTSIYSPIKKFFIRNGEKINMLGQQIPHENVRTIKVIMGDKSDNIDGISLMGDKTFLKFFPEVVDRVVNVSDILERGQQLLEEHKSNKALMNLTKGITKDGELGLEFFERNKKIVDLLNPLISDEGKEMVELYYRETLDPEGRGSKNLIRMMTEDGFFKYLPKDDEAFVNFVKPFTKLTRKEKRKFNQENN